MAVLEGSPERQTDPVCRGCGLVGMVAPLSDDLRLDSAARARFIALEACSHIPAAMASYFCIPMGDVFFFRANLRAAYYPAFCRTAQLARLVPGFVHRFPDVAEVS